MWIYLGIIFYILLPICLIATPILLYLIYKTLNSAIVINTNSKH